MNIKKIIAGILACAVTGLSVPAGGAPAGRENIPAVAAAEDSASLQALSFKNYGDYVKVKSCSPDAEGRITVPAAYEGLPVIGIGVEAFMDCDKVTSVVLPAGITAIDKNAFLGCDALTSITMPSGLTTIGASAFEKCSALQAVTVPEGVTSIGISAFSGCEKLTRIALPETLTTIGDYAFWSCPSLREIVIPDSVTSIGGGILADCTKLQRAVLSKNLTELPTLTTGENTFGTFSRCENLTFVILPENIRKLPEKIFEGCKRLSGIKLPNGLKEIGASAFEDCSALESITVPEGVTTLGASCFSACSSLGTVILPDSVTRAGNGAFEMCASLTDVRIPAGMESLSAAMFRDCTSLRRITVPITVRSIEEEAFAGCDDLDFVTLENPLCEITGQCLGNNKTTLRGYPGSTAEAYCEEYGNEFLSLGEIPAENYIDCLEYTLYADHAEITGTAKPGHIGGKLMIPDTISGKPVTVIADSALRGLEAVTVVLGDNVAQIGEAAFQNAAIREVTFGSGLRSIGQQAFENCGSLAAVSFGNNVQEIGGKAFASCKALSSVQFGSGLRSIGVHAFEGTAWLAACPQGVVYAGNLAFEYSGSLPEDKSVTFRDGTAIIGTVGVEQFEGMRSVSLPASVTAIAPGALAYPALKQIGLDEANKSFMLQGGVLYTKGMDTLCVFPGGSTAKSFEIPPQVSTIGACAFYGAGITSIRIPETVQVIEEEAFGCCPALAEIYICNPACVIKDLENSYGHTISNDKQMFFNGTIYGYSGSTAEQYARDYYKNFKPLAAETTAPATTAVTTTTTKATTTTTTTTAKATTTTAKATTTTAKATTTTAKATTTTTKATTTTAKATTTTAKATTTTAKATTTTAKATTTTAKATTTTAKATTTTAKSTTTTAKATTTTAKATTTTAKSTATTTKSTATTTKASTTTTKATTTAQTSTTAAQTTTAATTTTTQTTPHDSKASVSVTLTLRYAPMKTVYDIGEAFDIAGARFDVNVKQTDDDGTVKDVAYEDLPAFRFGSDLALDVSGFDSTKPGSCTVYATLHAAYISSGGIRKEAVSEKVPIVVTVKKQWPSVTARLLENGPRFLYGNTDGSLMEGVQTAFTYSYYDENGLEQQVSDSNLRCAYKTPGELLLSELSPYCKTSLAVTYDGIELPVRPTVYVGLKGDVNLDGRVNASDAAIILSYAAAVGAGNESKLLPDNKDPVMEQFAYFLGDIDGESVVGGTEGSKLNSSDAAYILSYAAKSGSGQEPDWYKDVLKKSK